MTSPEDGEWSSGGEDNPWESDDAGNQNDNIDDAKQDQINQQDERLKEKHNEKRKKYRRRKVKDKFEKKDACEINIEINNGHKKPGFKETIDCDGETSPKKKKKKKSTDALTMRTGGAYIPPAKLRLMQEQITDKNSSAYQRITWEALKKSINGLINKVNISNMATVVRELLKENVVRGRGVLTKAVIQAQELSPTFSHVYAAFVAILNTKFPQICELLLTRLILQFRRGFRRNDKGVCLTSSRFIAHLINQQVAHEVLALEILTLLLETPTDHSVEVSVSFLKECGMKLNDVSPRGVDAIFERLRSILHEGQLDKRVQYMIEVMFAVRKDGFKDHLVVSEGLDLVEEEDQVTHLITLEEATDPQDILNVFKHDPDFQANEDRYKNIMTDILEESSDDSWVDRSSESENDTKPIIDSTETNLKVLRKTIYLTINSSLDVEECAHKLLKMNMKPGQEVELCNMILDCCAQQRTYERFYGLLAQKFCDINKKYIAPFESLFRDSYDTIHRLETDRLRNVARFYAHLLLTDSMSWSVLSHIKLNEVDTTSSSRIFIKILFQDFAELMGLPKLNARVKDPTLQLAFDGLFPRNTPRNTRFAINFFTSIGLGGLTEDLRIHIKIQPKMSEKRKQSDTSDESVETDDGFWGELKPEIISAKRLSKSLKKKKGEKRKHKKDKSKLSRDGHRNKKTKTTRR